MYGLAAGHRALWKAFVALDKPKWKANKGLRKGQELVAGRAWVPSLLLAFSFFQELLRNPCLIMDGVSRFDIIQGEIGKVIPVLEEIGREQ